MTENMPDELATYKKAIKKAHEILDQQAMDEANEQGRKAGQEKREAEERIRKERAEKLKAEKERIANEEAAERLKKPGKTAEANAATEPTVAAEKSPKPKGKSGAKPRPKQKGRSTSMES